VELTLGTVAILIGAGLATGFINAVAGGGSAISLPVLEALLGATAANGTNRIAILFANASAVLGYTRGGAMPWRRVAGAIPAAVVGAAVGAWTATRLDNDAMKKVFAFVLVFIAVSVLTKPTVWLKERNERAVRQPWRSLVFFGIGFYGGFVQAGVGFLLLAGLVLAEGLDLVRGNGAKVLLILLYTPVALAFFAQAAAVNWAVGLTMAIGNTAGSYLAARLAVTRGARWIRWLLVVVAVGAAVRMLLA